MAVEKFGLVVFDFLPVFVQQTFEPLDFFFPALFFVLFAAVGDEQQGEQKQDDSQSDRQMSQSFIPDLFSLQLSLLLFVACLPVQQLLTLVQ